MGPAKSNLDYKFLKWDEYKHLTDEEIINLIRSGNKQLFEIIMRRYNQRLYRVQISYIKDEESVKDTLQTTYIKVFENLDSFRGDSKFSTWLTRIAINEALKFLNKNKSLNNLKLLEEKRVMNEEDYLEYDSPEKIAIQKDFKKVLEKVVNQIPPKYKSVYILREVENLDTKETAECLDISDSNVKVRLHRAKSMIQEVVNEKYSKTEIFDFLGERCDAIVLNVMSVINSD